MEATIVQEAAEILNKLSPKNQAYFMTLVRVAQAAENGVKSARDQSPMSPRNFPKWDLF